MYLCVLSTNLTKSAEITLDPATSDYSGNPYPFGMDPVSSLLPLYEHKQQNKYIE